MRFECVALVQLRFYEGQYKITATSTFQEKRTKMQLVSCCIIRDSNHFNNFSSVIIFHNNKINCYFVVEIVFIFLMTKTRVSTNLLLFVNLDRII